MVYLSKSKYCRLWQCPKIAWMKKYKPEELTKAKSVFPTDDSLLKMLYLAMMDITKKWTGRRQDWSVIHAQLAVFFADRMPD